MSDPFAINKPKVLRITATTRVSIQFPFHLDVQGSPDNVVLNVGDSHEFTQDDLIELDNTIQNLLQSGQIITETIGFPTPASDISYDTGSGLVSLQDFIASLATGVPPVVYGSSGSPVLVTALGGITFHNNLDEIQIIAGNGGPVVISANPQISAGTIVGQRLTLINFNSTNKVYIAGNAGGVDAHGDIDLGAADSRAIKYVWLGNAVGWWEENRR